jgi:DNA invertase Pin-like site-specific DNA recombinase
VEARPAFAFASRLLLILERVAAKGAAFRSLTESIETTSPAGVMLMQMLGAFAQFERSMIVERSRAGLGAAKSKGLKLGPRCNLDDQQRRMIVVQIESGAWTAADAARITGVSPATISRELARHRMAAGSLVLR